MSASRDASHNYSLSMKDATPENEQAVLQSLYIDNEKVKHINNLALVKLDLNKYQEIKELAYFSKGRDFQIHANIMYKNKVIGASCKIQHQQELQYCLILVTFLGSDTLHCVCDF